MKASAIAPSNVALIKYWGRKDEELRLPANASISINLNNLTTHTTVEFSADLDVDEVMIDNKRIDKEAKRVSAHLDRIRKRAKIGMKAKVVSQNSFPTSTGISSSASGFAALTVAGATAAGLNMDTKELSIVARQGSGSACRSIPDAWVKWHYGDTSQKSYAQSFAPANHWDIQDLVAVVSTEKKDVSTTSGHRSASSSPFFELRLKLINDKIAQIKQHIARKDFEAFGQLVEAEALELHGMMITSRPSLIYWSAGTLQLIKEVKKWRQEGLSAYFTLNTGQDMHILVEKQHMAQLREKVQSLPYVKNTIENDIVHGARITDTHLF